MINYLNSSNTICNFTLLVQSFILNVLLSKRKEVKPAKIQQLSFHKNHQIKSH